MLKHSNLLAALHETFQMVKRNKIKKKKKKKEARTHKKKANKEKQLRRSGSLRICLLHLSLWLHVLELFIGEEIE